MLTFSMAVTGNDNDNGIIYIHGGDLDLKIIKARQLPNMDIFSEHLRRCVTCDTIKFHFDDVSAHSGSQRTRHNRRIITSGPYMTFHIPLAHPVVDLEFRVKDDDVFGAQTMGTVKILAWLIATGQLIFDWFPIIGPSGKPAKRDTTLHMQMKFMPVEENLLYQRGIAADPEHCEVRNTYFSVRKGSSVRLYQEAQCPESGKGKLPEVKLENGEVYRHGKCWEGICYAISEAHHMVYLVGWSIYHKTHDEETKKFFKHSSVMCVLSSRYASNKMSFLKQQASVWIIQGLIHFDSRTSQHYSGIIIQLFQRMTLQYGFLVKMILKTGMFRFDTASLVLSKSYAILS
ncbi:unnamed protein product [Sphenostylis stenocarpa]|uniref:Uncharacterized protein n=1 Tax=Sphenostylis stenocarpa TaxID=92480 RepID=A0AA86SD91_9FABA|nr:unnamed protein product [Sphenostylis stenocarpa]